MPTNLPEIRTHGCVRRKGGGYAVLPVLCDLKLCKRHDLEEHVFKNWEPSRA